MIKHVILWKLNDDIADKEAVKEGIQNGLEGLAGKIPGLLSIQVNIHSLPSSNADLMLDSTFESEEALKTYSIHPEHVKVADTYVRPYTQIRMCLDYQIVS